MRFSFHYLVCFLLLLGCKSLHKKAEDPFPLKVSLQTYNVINLIPTRSGKSLDYLLKLDQWAQNKIKPQGFAGEGVMSLIEGAVDLIDAPKGGKMLSVDIVVSFEIKNDPQYGYKKVYFRVSEREKVTDKDIPHIENYLKKYLKTLDKHFFHEISSRYAMIVATKKPAPHDRKQTTSAK